MSDVEALTLLLPTASFLTAAVAVALALNSSERGFVSLVTLPRYTIPVSAIFIAVILAIGSVTAWCNIYGAGSPLPFPQFVVAASILVAIAGQCVLTIALAVGMMESD